MSGFRTFETSRVSFGDNRPKAPLVDAALVRPPIKRAPAKQWSEPKICQKGFIPPKPVTPEDFQQPCAFPLRRLMDLVCYITQFPAVHIRGQRRLGNCADRPPRRRPRSHHGDARSTPRSGGH